MPPLRGVGERKAKRKSRQLEGKSRGPYRTTHGDVRPKSANPQLMELIRKQLSSNIRYGVVANIAVSHTAAGGSIPPIGDHREISFLKVALCVDFLNTQEAKKSS